MMQYRIEQLKQELDSISMAYKNIKSYEIDDHEDIWITFKKNINVMQIREIEDMHYTITHIDFDKNLIKFSKRWDRRS